MAPQAYLMVVAIGSALVGLWLATRFERFAPQSGRTAGLCVLAAWVVSGTLGPLFAAARLHLPLGFAVLATAFPVLVATFALTAAALRYFVGLLGHTAR